MARIVILGGGFGGLTAAHALLPALAQGHAVTLIDRKSWFQAGLAKLWVLIGERAPETGRGDITRLAARGVRFVEAEIEAIDLTRRHVRAHDADHPWDRLIVATGAELAPDAVPGLAPEDNLYDPVRVPGLRDRLAALERGRIVVLVCAAPYKCPPAPFEASMLVDAHLRRRGARDRIGLEVVLPDAQPMPVAGPAAGARVRELLGERGIGLHTGSKPTSVDAARREIELSSGERVPFDLLLAVPPHRAPRVVREAGLTDATGFVPVDPRTLRTAHPDVYALGDVCAIKLPGSGMLPKAGILAERQAEVVAENLLAELSGMAPEREFDGVGHCFFEVGDGRAMRVEGAFFAEPGERTRFSLPSAEDFVAKQRFERERLERWFG